MWKSFTFIGSSKLKKPTMMWFWTKSIAYISSDDIFFTNQLRPNQVYIITGYFISMQVRNKYLGTCSRDFEPRRVHGPLLTVVKNVSKTRIRAYMVLSAFGIGNRITANKTLATQCPRPMRKTLDFNNHLKIYIGALQHPTNIYRADTSDGKIFSFRFF